MFCFSVKNKINHVYHKYGYFNIQTKFESLFVGNFDGQKFTPLFEQMIDFATGSFAYTVCHPFKLQQEFFWKIAIKCLKRFKNQLCHYDLKFYYFCIVQ